MANKDDNETSGSETPPKKGRPGSIVELGLDDAKTVTTGKIDLSAVSAKADVPQPKVEMKASEPQSQLAGKYTIKDGDTPFSVALEKYGRGSMGNDLRRKNRNVPWDTGSIITL